MTRAIIKEGYSENQFDTSEFEKKQTRKFLELKSKRRVVRLN